MTTTANDVSAMARTARDAGWLSEHAGLIRVLTGVADLAAVAVGCSASYWLVLRPEPVLTSYKVAVLLTLLFTWIVFNATGLYASWRGRGYVEQVRKVSTAWLIVIGAMVTAAYALGVQDEFSRRWLLLAGALGLGLLLLVRISAIVVLRTIRARGMNHKRLLIIGAGPWGREVAGRITASDWLGMDIAAYLDSDRSLHGKDLDGVPVAGDVDALEDVIATRRIDEVWICLPLRAQLESTGTDIHALLNRLRQSPVTQRLVPDIEEMRLLNQPITEIMGMPVVNLNTSPMVGTNRVLKALEDRLIATGILLLISPLMLIIAAAIRLDSKGPVIFRQLRHGWDGRPITIYKFRTMHVHDEDDGEVTQASRDDPRVTGLGRFLRRSSLDELPQFVNVLQGRMSIVGPRPHAVEHNRKYMEQIDSYMQRHKVKPGITGWAQVNGFRGETDSVEKMRQRVNLDLYYIEHWSIWFDLKIIARTLFTGFVGRNAY
jgi:putative colanic acid biosynthesis UDP-glucose lipid carrier transferase